MDNVVGNLNKQDWVKLFSSVANDYDIPMADLVSKYGHLFDKADKGPAPSAPPAPSISIPMDPLEVSEWEHEGITYYVDNLNRVYTHNLEAPTFIGWKTTNNTLAKLG